RSRRCAGAVIWGGWQQLPLVPMGWPAWSWAAAFNGPPRATSTAVSSPATQRPPAHPAAAQPLAAPAPAPHAPLDPPTIRSLQERIRSLLPPQLAAFSRAFRSAFQVPESTPSIAGLITEQRHHAWIQRYLAQASARGRAKPKPRPAPPEPGRLPSPARGLPRPRFPFPPPPHLQPCATTSAAWWPPPQ
ncbi:MAG: hypothetical protein ACKOPS_04455, partial [Cyanobium sp.]